MKESVNVLGTSYRIEQREEKNDPLLKDLGGYCEVYDRLIVIRKDWSSMPPKKSIFDSMVKEILRHEILHAFFYESGLWDNSSSSNVWATNEEMTDWFAIQGPKIYKAWREAGAL